MATWAPGTWCFRASSDKVSERSQESTESCATAGWGPSTYRLPDSPTATILLFGLVNGHLPSHVPIPDYLGVIRTPRELHSVCSDSTAMQAEITQKARLNSIVHCSPLLKQLSGEADGLASPRAVLRQLCIYCGDAAGRRHPSLGSTGFFNRATRPLKMWSRPNPGTPACGDRRPDRQGSRSAGHRPRTHRRVRLHVDLQLPSTFGSLPATRSGHDEVSVK